MPFVKISDEAGEILEKYRQKQGKEKKWLASICIVNHASQYVDKKRKV